MIFEPEKHLFLDISSTNIDTLVPSLYQCIETRSMEVFDCCLSHFRTTKSTSSSAKRLSPNCESLYATNASHRKPETFFKNIFFIELFPPHPPKENAQHNAALL
jgi:hypothetical protein